MNSFKIFIVEDDPFYGEMLKYHLSLNPDYEVVLFENAKDCLLRLNEKPNVISIDYNLPDINGDKLMLKIKKYDPTIPIIVTSAQEDIEVVLDILKNGAFDYIIKNDNAKEFLWNSILKIKNQDNLKEEIVFLKEQLVSENNFEKTIIGQSKGIKNLFRLIDKSLKININVSITGETGTGKELVAKAIHFNSPRNKKPFIAINASAIPKELIESELFGHEKGAFTGAVSLKKGKFEEANGGTIFLDEIAELDMSMQVKLLRVLQEREVVRVGGNKEIPFDVRIITATHKDLQEEVKQGNFRKDLYFRLIGLPISIPPLRDRENDYLILSDFFISEFCKKNKLSKPKISAEAKEKLKYYKYPGNVRELKSIIDLACVMSSGEVIEADDITFNTFMDDEGTVDYNKTLKEFEMSIITLFLKKYNNDVMKVAKKLDIGKSKIYNLLKDKKINNIEE